MRFKGEFALGSVLCYIIFLAVILYFGQSAINAYLEHSRNEDARAGAGSIGAAISQYHFEIGSFPDNLSDLTEENGQYGPWILNLPKDPWANGADFQYLHDDKKFAIFSVGKDKGASSSLTEISSDDVGFVGK
ncbi:hypothetical protein NZ47_05550 [Anaerovibrio lipolyticus]|uniref:Type II secretion system protein GspG C-terminal domain-containing protein n=1 Tax=Anaerovibrio lipolyticus TaxID=82374 RepID=A0A0B2JXK9_9FIRM|nr:type II secretion system protein GspG [Anaerovibrio lipolyticus]KHM52314.1 hypothetical protein NZ47_05550 [Anaerovibrio lipolyticus]